MALAPLKPQVPIPFGIKVDHVQHSEYGGSVEDQAEVKNEIADELQEGSVSSGIDLAPLKEKAPVPLGIKVNHVKHSEYGGSVEDQTEVNNEIADELQEGSVSSGIDLAPLKEKALVPLGIKVNHVQHSEYGGSVEDETEVKDELQEASLSSGIDLAPLKAEVPVPLGIKIAHVQHSEHGGADQSDEEQK